MLLTDVALHGYPTVLVNLGMIVVLALLLGATLRLLDPRLPVGSRTDRPAGTPAVPQPRSAAEVDTGRESRAAE